VFLCFTAETQGRRGFCLEEEFSASQRLCGET
jgi:hypothetical protein